MCFPCPSNLLRSLACLMLFTSNYFWASLITSTFSLSLSPSLSLHFNLFTLLLCELKLAIIHTVAVSSPPNRVLFSFCVCIWRWIHLIFADFYFRNSIERREKKLISWRHEYPFEFVPFTLSSVYIVQSEKPKCVGEIVSWQNPTFFLGFHVISAVNTRY